MQLGRGCRRKNPIFPTTNETRIALPRLPPHSMCWLIWEKKKRVMFQYANEQISQHVECSGQSRVCLVASRACRSSVARRYFMKAVFCSSSSSNSISYSICSSIWSPILDCRDIRHLGCFIRLRVEICKPPCFPMTSRINQRTRGH